MIGVNCAQAVSMKVKVKNGLMIKAKITSKEPISFREMEQISHVINRSASGFLQPRQMKANMLMYTGPDGISLVQRLRTPVSKYEFFYIMSQIVDATNKIADAGLYVNKIIFDANYVFINPNTRALQFMYLPLESDRYGIDLVAFMESIIYMVRTEEMQNQYVGQFMNFIKSLPGFDGDRIHDYIAKQDPNLAKQIKKSRAAQSGFMTNKPEEHYEHYGDSNKQSSPYAQSGMAGAATSPYAQAGMAGAATSPYAQGMAGAATSPYAQAGMAGAATSPYAQAGMAGAATSPYAQPGMAGAAGVGYANVDPQAEMATSLLQEEDTMPLAPEFEIEDDYETTLLDEWGSEVQPVQEVHYSHLVRVATGEEVTLDKPVFRIGKEQHSADYHVPDNKAVSRSHADVITRGTSCYIVDQNSKNHTYINNNMVPAQKEIELVDGDIVKLANEEFEFHI